MPGNEPAFLQPQQQQQQPTYRVCLSGQYGVGKSTIFQRVTGTTAGNTGEHTYTIPRFHASIQLKDTCGFERHNTSMTLGNYYRGCNCIVFVYDVTDIETLHYITREFEAIHEQQIVPTDDVKFVVVCNKVDTPPDRVQVTREMVVQHLDSHEELRRCTANLPEMSGRTGAGVNEFFRRDLKWILEDLVPPSPRVSPQPYEAPCC